MNIALQTNYIAYNLLLTIILLLINTTILVDQSTDIINRVVESALIINALFLLYCYFYFYTTSYYKYIKYILYTAIAAYLLYYGISGTNDINNEDEDKQQIIIFSIMIGFIVIFLTFIEIIYDLCRC